MIRISHSFSLIIILTIFFAHFSFADQTLDESKCTEVDVSEPLGPPRNQGNIGWCYANVAADLLTFRFQTELKGQKASAGFIAATFNQYMLKKGNADSGLITPAVVFSQMNGICPQEFQDRALKNSPFKTIREQINALVELKETYDKIRKGKIAAVDFRILQTYRHSQSYLNQIPDRELEAILDNSTNKSFPRKIADRLCEKEKIAVKFDLKIRPQMAVVESFVNFIPSFLKQGKFLPISKVGKTDLIEELHQQLDKKNMVAVGYYTKIFFDPESDQYKKSGLHASSIVGRKWNPQLKLCELKLRNSWGKNCQAYTSSAVKDRCESESGYVWIADTLLQSTINDMVYFAQ